MNTITATATSAIKTFSLVALTFMGAVFFTSCGDDDDMMPEPTVDLTGTFQQEDVMGRPAITTVFGGTDMVKNNYNAGAPNPTARAAYQPGFQALLEGYHDVYGDALGVALDYETNILGLDAATFTTVLANFDALQVAPEGQTTYFNPTTGLALTGRALSDDVIDVSLTLMFGGTTGTRFDGNGGTPQLTSDGVGVGDRVFSTTFPYLEDPIN